jgi:hypothetical protein
MQCCCCVQEPENIRTWQQEFGFKQLKQQQLRQLMADVPPLNYYEESVLLSKRLPKQQLQPQVAAEETAA